ncbi:Hypothetical protein SCF082_LOCUS33360 [Durusdinium trenchii]|uniref:Uncharacterized protein n=1 Tax=Durusdinium trenchii TaxID=1381693 RepID=A0ABP0NN36_9DINO
MRPLCGALAGAALLYTATAFSSQVAPPIQLGSRTGLQPRAIEGQSSPFAGYSSPCGGAIAFPGCAVGLAAVVTLFGKWCNKHRARWRKAVNSENRGRRGYRADRRPPLLGSEKPPHEKKKMYHYYCNKIYKVIRFAHPDTVEMVPSPKSWVEERLGQFSSRPGFLAKIATVISASAGLWFGQRLL